MLGVSPTLVRALIPHGEPDGATSRRCADLHDRRAVEPRPYLWLFEQVGGGARPDRQLLRRHRGRRVLPVADARRADQAVLARRPGARHGMDVVDAEALGRAARSASSSAASRSRA